MNHMMTSQLSELLTNSQETLIESEVHGDLSMGLIYDQFFDPPFEPKYATTQDLLLHEQELPVTTIQQQQQPPQMVTNEEFAGDLNFQLVPDQQDDKTWVYSPKMKKVFIEMERTLPLRIKWIQKQSDLRIRAVMAFCQPTHRSECVTRCLNHIGLPTTDNKQIPYLHHVLSCKNAQATYDKINGHYSVLVPLGTPEPGSDSVQMDFIFHCKNSCSTGINRRPTELVFSLENALGQVLGRRRLHIRICSCPKRDRDKDERNLRDQSAPKKRKIAAGKKLATPVYREHQLDPDAPEIFEFNIRIYGKQNYETLKEVAYGLMAGTLERTGQQTVIKPLLDELKRMP